MLGLKLNYVSERGPGCLGVTRCYASLQPVRQRLGTLLVQRMIKYVVPSQARTLKPQSSFSSSMEVNNVAH